MTGPSRARLVAFAVAALLLVGGGLSLAPTAAGAFSASSPVTGNVSGPLAIAPSSTHTYYVNGSGGPAYAPDGELIGNVSWYASVAGTNTTNVTLAPSSGVFVGSTPGEPELTVTNLTQILTITVEISSVYEKENVSTNLTYVVHVVTPYVVAATLVAGPNANVLGFSVTVDLDGTAVGTVSVPTLTANQSYDLKFEYATLGLSAGQHTFSISLAQEHGLVLFSGGATQFSETFYVPGSPPNYALWYLAGTIAFFGVLFILATRVAARRRGAVRR